MILPGWLWIPVTVAAAAAQTARNALQRGLVAELGGVGATLVRFLYGLPASLLLLLLALRVDPRPVDLGATGFLIALPLGAVAQILATILLLDLMGRRNFAIGVAWSKTEILLIALAGWLLLGDLLPAAGWLAVALATAGVLLLSGKGLKPADLFGGEARAVGWRGLASGAGFALAAVAYRAAILAAGGPGSIAAAAWALLLAQALQTVLLVGWLQLADRPVVLAVLRAWRTSIWAGTMGALASAGWFTAFSLAPAASVRTLGLVEMLMALLVGRRIFRERASPQELVGQALVAAAILLIVRVGLG